MTVMFRWKTFLIILLAGCACLHFVSFGILVAGAAPLREDNHNLLSLHCTYFHCVGLTAFSYPCSKAGPQELGRFFENGNDSIDPEMYGLTECSWCEWIGPACVPKSSGADLWHRISSNRENWCRMPDSNQRPHHYE